MARSLNEFLPNVQLWTYLFILYYESAIGDFALYVGRIHNTGELG